MKSLAKEIQSFVDIKNSVEFLFSYSASNKSSKLHHFKLQSKGLCILVIKKFPRKIQLKFIIHNKLVQTFFHPTSHDESIQDENFFEDLPEDQKLLPCIFQLSSRYKYRENCCRISSIYFVFTLSFKFDESADKSIWKRIFSLLTLRLRGNKSNVFETSVNIVAMQRFF